MASQFQLAWIDTLAAFVSGLIICKTAWEIFRDASHSLTDGFHIKDMSKYKETIEATPGVGDLKDIKARYLGSTVHVDVVVEVEPNLNIAESHDIADEIERRMKQEHDARCMVKLDYMKFDRNVIGGSGWHLMNRCIQIYKKS